MANGPQFNGDFVCKRGDQWHIERQQDLLRGANHFKIGKIEQIFEILPRQPVLQRLLFRKPRPFGDSPRTFPQTAEGIDDDARTGMREAEGVRKRLLHVPEIVDQIGNDDEVERFALQIT